MTTIRLSAFADEASEALDGQIAALKRNRIKFIEIRGVDGVNISNLSLDLTRAAGEKLSAAGIKVWSIGSPLGKINADEPFEKTLAILDDLLDKAEILGAKRIRMFSFFMEKDEYDKYASQVFERLAAMCEKAKARGVMLCHENESAIFGATVNNCEKLYDAVPTLKSVYDPSNFIVWGEDTDDALARLLDRADYIHIKDCVASSKTIVPSGYGDGKIDYIVKHVSGDKTMTLEPHLYEFTGYSQIDKKPLKNQFKFANSDESFDFAVNALKKILIDNGFSESEEGTWTK